MFHTYIHRNNQDGKVFYVGMANSKSRRFNKSMRNSEWQNAAKNGRTVEVVAYWDNKEQAASHEKLLISCFKDMGHPLVNKSNGGLGNDAPKLNGWAENHSKKMIGNVNRIGTFHSDQTKAKMSLKRAGVIKPKFKCMDCGRIIGGHSNINNHQKSTNHVGKEQL